MSMLHWTAVGLFNFSWGWMFAWGLCGAASLHPRLSSASFAALDVKDQWQWSSPSNGSPRTHWQHLQLSDHASRHNWTWGVGAFLLASQLANSLYSSGLNVLCVLHSLVGKPTDFCIKSVTVENKHTKWLTTYDWKASHRWERGNSILDLGTQCSQNVLLALACGFLVRRQCSCSGWAGIWVLT